MIMKSSRKFWHIFEVNFNELLLVLMLTYRTEKNHSILKVFEVCYFIKSLVRNSAEHTF